MSERPLSREDAIRMVTLMEVKHVIHWIRSHLLLTSTSIALVCAMLGAANASTAPSQSATKAGDLTLGKCDTSQDPVGVLPENHTQICGEVIQAKISLPTPVAELAAERGRLTWLRHAGVKHLWIGPSLQILFCTWLA